MAMTLTETAAFTRKGLVFLIIFLVVALSGWIGFQAWYTHIYLPSRPKVVPSPNPQYGILPRPQLPSTATSSAYFTYTLNTQSGNLPTDIPPIVKVYFSPQLGVTLLAPDKAKSLATKFSFNTGPDIVTPTKYRFSDQNNGQFLYDLNSGNFSFSRNVSTTSAIPQDDFLADENQIGTDFKQYLSSKGSLPDTLKTGRTKVFYSGNSPKESSSAAVSLWPADIDNFPVVTPNFSKGLIQATLTKAKEENDKYLSLDYIFWSSDPTQFYTYPTRPVAQAFEDLKNGQAAVIEIPTGQNVSITSIYLAYFEGVEYTPYIQPVFVFSGDNFIAFVPAITDDFLSK